MTLMDTDLDGLKYEIEEEARSGTQIKVIGVGGAGSNAVARMVAAGCAREDRPRLGGGRVQPARFLESAISGAGRHPGRGGRRLGRGRRGDARLVEG